MLILTSIVLTALLGSVAGFVVPTNLPDGLYTVYENSDIPGCINHPRNLFKRLDGPKIECPGYKLDGTQYSNALDKMNNWCNNQGGTLTGTTALQFFVSDTAVAYVCNYSAGSNTCFHEFEEANSLMDTVCKRGIAGYVTVAKYAKTLGRANTGVDVCNPGTHAKTV